MQQTSVFVKTEAGVEEVHDKGHKLPPKLRTMLILIDGSKPTDILIEQATKIGAQEDFLEILRQLGLITAIQGQADSRKPVVSLVQSNSSEPLDDSARRFLEAQKFMNVTAVNSSPMRSFFFTLKLEKCSTLEELEALIDDYYALISKGSGAEEADVLMEKVRELFNH